MRNLKFSFALVVAIFAIGLAVASKANTFGKNLVTACFTNPILVTASNTGDFDPLAESTRPVDPLNCEEVRQYINTNGVIWLKSSAGLVPEVDCDPEPVEFCCIVFDRETTQPGSVPLLTIDGLAGYYKIVDLDIDIKCKP